MATEKDLKFVEFLLDQTKTAKVDWEQHDRDQFITSLKRDIYIIVGKGDPTNETLVWLCLRDNSGDFLRISGDEIPALSDLFAAAKRNAFGVDAALDEMMSDEAGDRKGDQAKGVQIKAPIKDEDIPF